MPFSGSGGFFWFGGRLWRLRPLNRVTVVRGMSFAVVVGGSAPMDDLPVWELSFKNGCPALILTNVEIARLSAPYKSALIFKFFTQHIPNSELQRGLSNWGVHGRAHISVIDRRHVLVNFNTEADFMKVYTRERWIMKGQSFKVFRWSPWFCLGLESESGSRCLLSRNVILNLALSSQWQKLLGHF